MSISALALTQNPPQKAPGDPYLKFRLDARTSAVFAMRYVQEALVLPTRRITPMPNMPACLLGLMNRRSKVMWVVDLAQLLGLANRTTAPQYTLQYNLIMVQVGTVSLGLSVEQVKGISWIQPDAIQSPIGQINTALVPYLRGCVLDQHEQRQELVLVLDAEAIVHAPVLCGTDT